MRLALLLLAIADSPTGWACAGDVCAPLVPTDDQIIARAASRAAAKTNARLWSRCVILLGLAACGSEWPADIEPARDNLAASVEASGLAPASVVLDTLSTAPMFQREPGPVIGTDGNAYGAVTEGLRGNELVRYGQRDGWCLQRTYLVHELTHVLLWRLFGNPDKPHALAAWWAASKNAQQSWGQACSGQL